MNEGEPPKYSTINARVEGFETGASYRQPWKRSQLGLGPLLSCSDAHFDAKTRRSHHDRRDDQGCCA